MTVAELRALLAVLPARFDETEVTVVGSRGLVHVEEVELDRRRYAIADWLPEDRRERKLRLRGWTIWHEKPRPWRLRGWWPAEAADIGINTRENA